MGRGKGTSAGPSVRVLVIEDHALLGQVLVASMEQEGITARLACGPTIDAILDAAIEFKPHLVLLDLDLGQVGDGRQLIAPLRDRDFEIILVTGSRDTVQIAEGLEAGACGVMRKEEPFERLRDAILAVIAGQNGRFDAERQDLLGELYHHRAERAHRLAPFDRLTAREQEVLTALSAGMSAAAIAEDSFVSLSTVRSQIRAVLTKLGVASQLAAVALAKESQWL